MTVMQHERAAQRAAARGKLELATAHRRGADRLKDAEEAACRDVARSEVAVGLEGLSIGSVDDIRSARGDGEPEVVGARLLVALQGRSLERMGRVIQCRAARGAVRGADGDPFGVPGTLVRVSPGDAGWAIVEVQGSDSASGEKIVTRARHAAHEM